MLIKLIRRLIGFWTDHWSAWINCSSWAGRLPQLDWKHLDPPPRPETRRSSGSALTVHRTASKTSIHANFSLSLTTRKVKEESCWSKIVSWEENYGAQGLEIHAFHMCPSVAPWVEKQSFLLIPSLTLSFVFRLLSAASREIQIPSKTV